MDEQRLILIDSARQSLEKAKKIPEIKEIRDKTAALIDYFKRQQDISHETVLAAEELRLRAELRMGKLLKSMDRQQGGRPEKPSSPMRVSAPTLSELGISYNQSSRYQKAAELPDEEIEELIATEKAKGEKGDINLTKAYQAAKAKEYVADEDSGLSLNNAACTVSDLTTLNEQFGTIYADPPWKYQNQGTRSATDNHYKTMSIEEIKALPIANLAADNAHLHLWTTNAFLFECAEIIKAWGFTYKSMIIWVKPSMGIGNYWRVSHELLLLGVRGKCPFLNHSQLSWHQAERVGHSVKPEVFRKKIEQVSPGPRLELFARRPINGWTVWGDEISLDHFSGKG
jgi:N6-adenosine-specific RNA methylase IME4